MTFDRYKTHEISCQVCKKNKIIRAIWLKIGTCFECKEKDRAKNGKIQWERVRKKH